jgi:hypothetical protein
VRPTYCEHDVISPIVKQVIELVCDCADGKMVGHKKFEKEESKSKSFEKIKTCVSICSTILKVGLGGKLPLVLQLVQLLKF